MKMNISLKIDDFIQNLHLDEVFLNTPIFLPDDLIPSTIYNRMTAAVPTVVVLSEVFERLM